MAQAEAQTRGEGTVSDLLLKGGVIMPRLGNATVKAELGRASWKLLHTMAARFPEQPDDEEKEAFKSFIYLFSRLYPCGECAAEFQALLKLHPPQTSSRGAASLHLCHLHNLVNKRLGKEEFDCSAGLAGIYDCGCAEEDTGLAKEGEAPKPKGRGRQRLTPVGAQVAEEEVKRDPFTGQELVGG